MKYIYIQSELENSNRLFIWVYGLSNIVGYLMPNQLLYKK